MNEACVLKFGIVDFRGQYVPQGTIGRAISRLNEPLVMFEITNGPLDGLCVVVLRESLSTYSPSEA